MIEIQQCKILHLEMLPALLASHTSSRIVHCHGVFDLVHPGHIRHFQEAKRQGDILIVSLTPDRYVNKGPERPMFSELYRLEQVAALSCVDYVVLNDSPDAISMITRLRPHVYVKGKEYADHEADVTGKIAEEVAAVRSYGGDVYYTDDIVFSSSSILNTVFDPSHQNARDFLSQLKTDGTAALIPHFFSKMKTLRVMVLGDAILDEYQYVEPLGQAGKGLHMTAELRQRELFLGGSLIIANHLSQFVDQVTLVTAYAPDDEFADFIRDHLAKNVDVSLLPLQQMKTLVKRRYVTREGDHLIKLFETYSHNNSMLSTTQSHDVALTLQQSASQYDMVLLTDFGNGFVTPEIRKAAETYAPFLALNVQTNSGNRGFNLATQYHRADFMALNEPEVRLALHDRNQPIEELMLALTKQIRCPHLSVTRGMRGALHLHKESILQFPALTSQVVDRVGAGDVYLTLGALAAAVSAPPGLILLLGAAAAAMAVQQVGNAKPISHVELQKYLQRLLK